MTNPYDIAETRSHRAPAASSGGGLRTLLWVLLAVSVLGNVVASAAGVNVIGNVLFGILTTVSVAGLIVLAVRGRRG